MMLKRSASSVVRFALIAGAMAATAACAATGRPGEASSYLVVESLLAAPGAKPTTFTGTLASDVLTNGGILEDPARAAFRLVMKDPAILSPSPVNFITLRGYRVTFSRADGRNTPGVDVPYAFDGALSTTITGTTTVTLILVRAQAKLEAPLRALAGGGGALAISTFADVVFYGADQAGHDVTVTARISVTFADWGDEG